MDSSQILPEGYQLTSKQLKSIKKNIIKLAKHLDMEIPKFHPKTTLMDNEMVPFMDDLFYNILKMHTCTYGCLGGVNGATDGYYFARITLGTKDFYGGIYNGKDYSCSHPKIVKAIVVEHVAKHIL